MRFGTTNLSPKNLLTYDLLMKIELLMAGISDAGTSTRAESKQFRIIFGVFWPIQVGFAVREPFCDLESAC